MREGGHQPCHNFSKLMVKNLNIFKSNCVFLVTANAQGDLQSEDLLKPFTTQTPTATIALACSTKDPYKCT